MWSNSACLGYVIAALENLEYRADAIRQVTDEMKALFDWVSIDEAKAHFRDGPY